MSDKIYTIDEIRVNLKQILKDTDVLRVILFGCYAKNMATKSSDLDLIIDTNQKLMGFKLFSLIDRIEEFFGKK